MIQALKKHKVKLKAIFSLIFLFATVYLSYGEIRSIDFQSFGQIYDSLSVFHRISIIVLGVLSFFTCTLYDYFYANKVGLKVSTKDILVVGWITESFDNFVGFGGLTGITLRDKYLNRGGHDTELVKKEYLIIFMTEVLGLLSILLFSFPMLKQFGFEKYTIVIFILCLYIPFYLFGDKIRFFERFQLPIQNFSVRTRVQAIFISAFEWLVAALYFVYLISLFEPKIHWYYGIIIYALATLIGLFSMIPGGIGSFDIIIISAFSAMGHDANHITVSLLLYRVIYYLLPWVISLVMMTKDIVKDHIYTKESIAWDYAIRGLAYFVFFVGAIFVLSTARPDLLSRWKIMRIFINRQIYWYSEIMTTVIGILLMVFSIGIRKRVRRVYYATLILLMVGGISMLFKGLDVEEAILSFLLASILFVLKDHFNVQATKFSVSNFLSTMLSIVFAVVLYMAFFNIRYQVHFFRDTKPFSLEFLKVHFPTVIGFTFMMIFVATCIQFTRFKRVDFIPVVMEDVERFRDFLEKYPGNEFTHLFYLYDKNLFFNHKETVMMMYRPENDFIIVLGDPIGEETDFEDAIDEFMIWADSCNMKVIFYEISGKKLEYYCDQGYKFLKIGQEAFVDLSQFTLTGKKNKSWRHVKNNFEKFQFTFEVSEPTDEFIHQLKEVSDSWLGSRQELRFSLGFFDEDYLKKSKIACIRNGEQILAFANLQYFYDETTISVDLMRFSKDAPPGVMDMVFLELILWAKENGYSYFYLGMAPLSDVGKKRHSATKEKLMHFVYNLQNTFYNFKGLRNYKNKFKPQWQNKYIAYDSDVNLPYILLSLGICTRAIKLKNS